MKDCGFMKGRDQKCLAGLAVQALQKHAYDA
jgi:hypothetical protein